MYTHLGTSLVYGAIAGIALYAYWRLTLDKTWSIGGVNGPVKVPITSNEVVG